MRRLPTPAVFACVALLAPLLRGQTAPLYSIDGTDGPPTDEETAYLEYINRARANPPAEGGRLRTTTDADVVSAVTFFRTDLALLGAEFDAIAAAPPLAFHPRLLNASRGHSRDQFNNQFQGHTGSNGSTLSTRFTLAGYAFARAAENVFASAASVFHGHAGFEIDWGNEPGGMQAGRGHRVAIHDPNLREIGVGVVLGTNGSVGPQVVTQNFGTQLGATPLLTGVAYCDLSGDAFYTAGEGLGGISVIVTGAGFSARTSPSGAFTVPLPGNGTFTVRFSGLGLDETGTVTVAGAQNVKLDLRRTFTAPALTGPATPPAGAAATYTVGAVPGATRYDFVTYRRDLATPAEPADSAARVTLSVGSGYDVVQTAVRAAGAAAFNLRAVAGTRSQTITLNRLFLARGGAALTFASRLALASTSETVRVQTSVDGGATWADRYTQAGSGGPGEGGFTTRTISLDALEGRTFQVRLLHAFPSGSFFVSGGPIGWYVDDLRLPGCEELTAEPPRDLGSATSFTFTPDAPRVNYLLQVVAYNGSHRLGGSEMVFATSGETIGPTPAAGGYLANLSVRTTAGTGAQTLIVGFAVSGGSKPLLVRGIGPALVAFGVPALLADPKLELFQGTTRLLENDNWEAGAAAAFTAVGAFALTPGSRDAALVTTLGADSYTAQVSGVGGTTGTTLVELYDTAGGVGAARLSNVSARSQVGTGSDILIAGFNVAGTGARTLLIRAVGPTLAVFGITGVLADPKLELYTGTTKLQENDNWDAATAPIAGQVGAFNLTAGSRDAVLLVTLLPGSYTVQISGVGNTTGVALVEVYDVP